MTDPDDLHDDEENPIETIAAEFVERLRVGESPTVDEYADRYPDLAEDIRELLPTVVQMEKLKLSKERPERSRFLKGPSLDRLGDFLIKAEIGRGGMGIVYQAEQQSLGREVAVKVLPRQSLLDDQRIERFEREAQTAARLHHTNIVPIFGVGEQDGYHYYVMQYIKGLGLDQVIRTLRGDKPRIDPRTLSTSRVDLARDTASGLLSGLFRAAESDAPSSAAGEPDPAAEADAAPATASATERSPSSGTRVGAKYWRSVARVGMQVADALRYAHSQGTLHRDIKPANLLLDEAGVVWVTDFGLAKAIEDTNLTRSGDVVGTLQYMAPEQFHGDYDARSDIYCLGLTLYELLTWQPAFAGSNRSGLIQNVTSGRVTGPRRLRSDIPADLETIVLKTITSEPRHRYQSAEALRDDLQRFLEDRPIKARRLNVLQLGMRWCRRNKAIAAAVAVAILAVVSGAAVGWTNYVSERRKSKELADANRETGETLSRALSGFGNVIDHLAGPDLFQSVIRDATVADTSDTGDTEDVQAVQVISAPIPSKAHAELLEKILGVYAKFAQKNADHAVLKKDTARAYQKIGDIRMRLGEADKAGKAYVNSIIRYRQIDEAAHAITIASIRNQLGQAYAQQHLLDSARESHMLVIESLSADGEPRFPDDNQAMYELARAHDLLGSWGVSQDAERSRAERSRGDRSRGGRSRGERSRGERPRVGRGRGERPSGDRSRSRSRGPFPRPGRPERPPEYRYEQREAHHKQAQKLLYLLTQREPDNPVFKLAFARNCRNYYGFVWLGRPEERRNQADRLLAEKLMSDAIGILRELKSSDPEQWVYQYELAETLLAGQTGVDEAVRLAGELLRESPTVPAYAELKSRALRVRAGASADPGQRREDLSESVQLLSRVVRELPDNLYYLRQLARARRPLAEWMRDQGDDVGARLQIERMIGEYEEFLSKTEGPRDEFRRQAGNYDFLARVLRDLGLHEEADQARRESMRTEMRRRGWNPRRDR